MANKIEDLYVACLTRGLESTDRLSTEVRSQLGGMEELYESESVSSNSIQSLPSILATVAAKRADTLYFEGKELNIENILPSKKQPQKIDYSFDRFWELYNLLPENSNKRTTAYYLLEQFGSRIAFESCNEGTSVFDHNRILASVAACANNGIVSNGFSLLKGGVSGIQKHIYSGIDTSRTGSTKKLSKRLRGRSFLIAILTDLIGEWLIDALNLEQANIIFSGGGQFLILAPGKLEIDLNEFTQNVNFMLLNILGEQISFTLANEACTSEILTNSSAINFKVNQSLENQKKKQHQTYLSQLFDRSYVKEDESHINDDRIGGKLPKSNVLVQLHSEQIDQIRWADQEDGLIAYFQDFNTKLFLLSTEEDKPGARSVFKFLEQLDVQEIPCKAKVIRLNEAKLEEIIPKLNSLKTIEVSFGFKFIGKFAPAEEGDIVPFEQLANKLETDVPIYQRQFPLTIMRMDIDDLGVLFAEGLGQNKSLTRLASLSREFHLFFCGYFNELAKQNDIYITYSGGDDAFVIGSWIKVLNFTTQLYKDFKEFTCHNKDVHFSAGIYQCNPHYPISRFALDTEAQLNAVKDRTDKNGISVFGRIYDWDRFILMLEFAKKLESVTNTGDASNREHFSQTVIQRLLLMIKSSKPGPEELKEKPPKPVSTQFYKNAGLLRYLLSKHNFHPAKLNDNKDQTVQEILPEILKDFGSKKDIFDYLLPTQYVLFKTREHKLTKKESHV